MASMTLVMFLAPFSLGLGLLALAAFVWSLRSGQYNDPSGDAARILVNDPEDRPDVPPGG
jgi:cbb3-type cytochrome oxidase maturation protein